MGRKKKMPFQLNPEWMLKEPIDFEYNKYTLLDYIQKCEQRFNNLELYPDFVELSLHLANIQTLVKENKVFLTNKKFEFPDDEILLRDLLPKDTRELNEEEETELDKTIRYSGNKLLEVFNLGKSIWSLAFQNVDVYIRKNKENVAKGHGYSFYYKKDSNTLFVWEYYVKKQKSSIHNTKLIFKEIYKGEPNDNTLIQIIENYSSFNQTNFYKDIPIFETTSYHNFPMEQTLIPIMKRKITSYLMQTVNTHKSWRFDYDI